MSVPDGFIIQSARFLSILILVVLKIKQKLKNQNSIKPCISQEFRLWTHSFISFCLIMAGHLSFTLIYHCVVNTRWERWDTKMTKVTKSPDLFNCILQMKKIVIFAFRISGLQTLNIHFHTLLYVFIIHTLLYYIGNEWELTKINENVWN